MKRKRHLIYIAVLLALISLAVVTGRRFLFSRLVPARSLTLVSGQPYSMMQVTRAQDKDGRKRITERRTVAVDRRGTEAWISVYPEHSALGPTRRIIRADGQVVMALEKLSLRMTQFMKVEVLGPEAAARHMGAPACRAAYEKDLGPAVLAGVNVRGAVFETVQKMRTTEWRAPGYACLSLAVLHEKWLDGRWQFLAESRTVWFRPGDPDPRFFDETWFQTMKETSPAQLIRRIAEATGANPADCPACFNQAAIEEMDKQYYRNQAPPP